MVTAGTIKAQHADVFTFLHGDLGSLARHCDTPEHASPDSLVFISEAAQLTGESLADAAIVILLAKTVRGTSFTPNTRTCYFSVNNVPMGMATLLQYFDLKRERFSQWGTRHPTAIVHPDARIGSGVLLGPYCVVGARAVIGDLCMIGAHTVIENDVNLGARSVLHAHVFVGAGCQIGTACEIHPHTAVGSDGFGYAAGPDGRPRKIPQLGNVVIGNDVEIGSGCTIDRATLTSTHVRSGNKIDNQCHIAHNCDLGENGRYTAGFMMGGSTTIGRRFVTGGNSVVTAHVTLGDDISLAGRSTVTNDVPVAGAYGGYPLQPLNEALKTLVSVGRLDDMRRSLNRVLKHLRLEH